MSLRADKSLVDAGVTHVLTVFGPEGGIVESESTMPLLSKVDIVKRISIEDTEDVNLMQYFDETYAFIDDAVQKNEGVLVHCIAGISRSVTCVVAYLMKKNKWDAHEAIEFVRSKRPVANPNTGFREQLECYYRCGYNVTESSKPYREFLLSQKARENNKGETVYTDVEMPPMVVIWKQLIPSLLKRIESKQLPLTVDTVSLVTINGHNFSVMEPVAASLQDAGTPVSQLALNNLEIEPEVLKEVLDRMVTQTFTYRCKMCSATLATSASQRPHKPGSRGKCQDYFFEPIEWMRPELEKGELEGRLSCPKCHAKVGSYSWKGNPCTCAVWVTPSFKLNVAKVDRMASVSKPNL